MKGSKVPGYRATRRRFMDSGKKVADTDARRTVRRQAFEARPTVKHLPNIITLSRVPILFVIAGFLALSVPPGVRDALSVPASPDTAGVSWAASAAFVLFVLGAVSDWLDGWVARRYNLVSNFGKLMDALTDKILNIGMFIVLQAFGVFPRWFTFLVLLILMRELLITGLRLVAAGKGIILAAERSGKIKTVLQIVSISLLLGVLAIRRDAWAIPARLGDWLEYAGFVCFHVATLMTVTSGAGYLVKYWDVFMGDAESAQDSEASRE